MTATSCCAPCGPSPTAPVLCFFCGEPEVVELFEIWEHEFMWETCCESLHESLCQQVADDPPWGRELLRRIGVEAFTGHQLRRLADDGTGGLVLDWQLQARPIAFKAACAFVRTHHAHCGPPVIIWTTCISTGAPGSVGVPCGQMERSNGKIWDPARGRHRRISRRSG